MEIFINLLAFSVGLIVVVLTLFSAISTFVLPRAARSQLNRVVFGVLRRVVEFILHFAKTYERRDAIMAYYAPIGILLLVPTWYILISLGFTAMYWSLGAGDWLTAFRLSGSSLFTLGFANADGLVLATLEFIEAMLGLILDKLADYWKLWEAWFADVEESHTTLPALVFFRSPRAENSWVTASGTVLDAAAITLSAIDIPYEASAALCIRSGFLAFRRIANYFDIPNPQNPHYPETSICVERAEFDSVLDQLAAAGLPLKADREQAWKDFAGWRVNYDRSLILLCGLVMAPKATWSGDRVPDFRLPPFFIFKKKL
jgi:hypothetical protein